MSLVELYITFIEKNGTLLKVFGQVDQNSAEFLEKLLYQYTDTFDRLKVGEPKAARDIYPGLRCCARYKDNKYYRAEVKSIVQLTPGYVSVFFIDYGNTDRVKLSDIRLLDDIREPTLSNLHSLATEYYLAGVRPVTSEWDEHTINFIEEAIRYRSVKCAVIGEVIGKKLVKIFWGESDVSSYLIGMGAAVPVTQEVQEILIETSSGVVPTRYSVPPPAPVATPSLQTASVPSRSSYPSMTLRNPSVGMQVPFTPMVTRPTLASSQSVLSLPTGIRQPPPVMNVPPPSAIPPQPFSLPVLTQGKPQGQFASEMLPESSEHAVYVSHVEDGPLSFAVQLKAVAEHALTDLMAALNEHDPVPISRPLLPGSICLGRFSEDQSLCRAVVMLVMNDKCRLYYPDYGNSEILPCSQIYDMPLQFLETKVMALRFTLAGFKNVKVTQEMKDIFKDIVTDKELVMKVSPMEENRTKQYCELYLNRRNVREIMKERIAKLSDLEYVKLHVPPRGSIERVIVSFVESPTRVVVQLESNKDTLSTVMSCVAAHCRDNAKNLLKANHLKQNMPVCALYPIDSTWYRAQIKDFSESEATVLFVDYGNEDAVPISSLRRISPDLVTKVRVQALECCLAGFEMSQSDQEIADLLYNIINEKTLTMQVLEVMKNQVLIVHLLDENSVNVSTFLKQTPTVSPPLTIAKIDAIHSPPPVESNDDGWNEEPEIRHPVKGARDFQPGSGRNDNQGGKRFMNDDSERKNWRSNSNNSDSFSPRDKGDRFFRDERKSGRWNKDEDNKNWRSKDDGDTKDNWRNEDSRPPRKWDRSGDADGSDDRSNKRWENKDRNNDSGGGKWDRTSDGDDKFKKRDFRDRNRDGDGGSFNKWNRDNDRGNDSGGFSKWNKDNDRSADSGGFNKWNKDNDRGSDGGGFKKWNKDDKDGDGGGFNKWNKDNDRGNDGGGFKKWNKDDKDGDGGGFNKWNKDNDRGSDGGGFKKWNKDDRDGDGGGFNKWNKDNDRGERSFGDGPKRFDDKKFGKSSDSNWNSKPRSRGDDFGSRGGSKFESKKTYSQYSSGSGGGTPVPPKKVMVPYPDVTVGDKENIEVVYSLSPAEFFVQVSKHKDELTNLMSTIATNYTTDGAVLTSPEKGMYCIAMYSEDEVWYRALIESVNLTTANVLFIDYGNSEEIPLEKLKVMTSDLGVLSAQAIKCGLLAVKPRSNDKWSDEEQTEFAVATEGKTLQADIKNKTFANDTFQIILRDITEGEEGAPVINTIFNATEEELSSSCVPIDSVITFKPYPLTIGEALDVQVTWFISPDSFFIQPLCSNPAFREMMEHIQEHVRSFKHLSPFDVQVGKNIIARFKDDKVLYRAEIKETGFVGPLVYFVDYGNSETVEKNQLYEVKPEYSLIPCQAIACSLAGVKPSGEEWPKLGSSNIEHFFEADSYKCTVLALGENGNYIVSLDNQDGSNVYKQLIDNGLAVTDPLYTIPVEEAYTTIQLRLLLNQTLLAHVTCVESTSKFFVQLLPLETAKLQQELDELISKTDSLKKVEPDDIINDMLCISTLDGTLWQRAIVVNKSGTSGPLIRFIDNGASGEVSNDKVLQLPSELSSVPAQAVECYLGISELAEADENEFKSAVFDKDVIINVDEVDSERLQVTVYSNDGTILKLLQEKTDKTKQVDVVCPMPILKKEDRLTISHAESGAIFVQRVSKLEVLKELTGELYEYCEGIASCDVEWQVDALCCAKSPVDDQWYRAKLLTVEPEFSVKYLDYGNSEVVAADRLRKLEISFYKPEAFAHKVKMAVNWLVSEEHLLELVPEKEFSAKIINWHDDWYIELIDDNNENLKDKLIELGFATEMESSPFIKKVSSISKLSTGLKVNVCRSHICSPSQFCVILNEDFEDLEHLQDRLQNSVTTMKNITGTLPNTMIAAKFSDGIWYRAIYLQEENSIFSVDYGNTEISTGEFKELSEDFLTPDGYAITCALNVEPNENIWSNEAIEYFDSLIPDDVIVAHILKMDKIVTVDIKVNDESISKALIDKGFAVKSILTSSIYISHVNSLSDFYVQEENPLLEQIREHLMLSDKFNQIEDIGNFTGDIFATQYHIDGLWYRAKLLSSDESGHNVLFVDYGNSDVAAEFKELPNELLGIPLIAKKCSLKLPDSVETWNDGALEKFIELVADGSTLFEIKFLTDDEQSLVELSLNGELVSEMINLIDSVPCEENPTDNLGDQFRRVVVSHVNNPCDFWIQSENAPLAELADYFVDVENWNVLDTDAVIPNQLVAALFDEDAQWYRAKVLNLADNGCVDVLFIDYGNSSAAKELRQLPEDLSQLPPAAKHSCMEFPDSISEWSTEIINHFKELIGHGTEILTMETISTEEPMHVKLFNGENDIALKLSEMVFEKDNEKNPQLEKISENLDAVNKLNILQTVNICHINSPADFYIHSDKNKIDEMVNAMCEGDNFEPTFVKSPGALVAARFVDDGQWYRATITRSEENSYEVFFVDYGNSASVTELRSLPQNLVDIPHLAQLCSFQTAGGIEDWSESAIDKFFELSADGMTEFGLKIISEGFPNVVELILDGKPVSLLLVENENSNNEIKQQNDEVSGKHLLNTINVVEELDETELIRTDTILVNEPVLTSSENNESNEGNEKQSENEESNEVNETQLQGDLDEPQLDNLHLAEELHVNDIEISNGHGFTSESNEGNEKQSENEESNEVNETQLQGDLDEPQLDNIHIAEELNVNDEEISNRHGVTSVEEENTLIEKDVAASSEKVTELVLIEKDNEDDFTIDQNVEKYEREEDIRKQNNVTNLIETIKEVDVINKSEFDLKEDDKIYSSDQESEAIAGGNTFDGINLSENNDLLINKTVINDNASEFESNQSIESLTVVDNKNNFDFNDRNTELPIVIAEKPVGKIDNSANIELDVNDVAKSNPITSSLDSDLQSAELAVEESCKEKEGVSSRLENNLLNNSPPSSEKETNKTDISCSDKTFEKIPLNEKIAPSPISHGNQLNVDESASTD